MRRYISLLLFSLLTSLAQAQSTSLRQPRIFAGDIAELLISYESELPSMYSVDTTPLEPDFEVLETSSRVSRVQRDNRSAHLMEWRALLLPRRSGLLSIPALRYGAGQSEALRLAVDPVPTGLQALQNVFVEIEAIPQNPYPGQQTRIATRLYHNLPLPDGVLGEPESTRGRVYRSTSDARYEVIRDGETFTVLERNILLAPSAAGPWRIQPASFRGSVVAPQPGETYGLAGATRYIYRASNALILQVRDLPEGKPAAPWLPARQLEMNLQWEPSQGALIAGASLGLSLDLQSIGLSADSLPADLLLRESDQYRIYADQAKRSTRVEGPPGDEVLTGRLQQRYAVVFEQAGDITLPPLELAWWDTKQDRARVARVEAITLTITAPASSLGRLRAEGGGASTVNSTGALPPQWLALALAGIALLGLTWIAWRQSSRLLAWLKRARWRRASRLRLERACADNDAAATRRGLIDWSRAYWQDDRISSLRQIAARSGLQAWVDELARLDAAMFAAERGAWQGQGLRRLLEQQRRRGAARERKRLQALPGLYPRQGVIP